MQKPAIRASGNETARIATSVFRLLPSPASLNGLNATIVYPLFAWNKTHCVKSNIVTFENLLVTPLEKGLLGEPLFFVKMFE